MTVSLEIVKMQKGRHMFALKVSTQDDAPPDLETFPTSVCSQVHNDVKDRVAYMPTALMLLQESQQVLLQVRLSDPQGVSCR
jgi:hypothetical protein